MNRKKKIKMSLDILMTIALLFLMAFQVTGDKYHEWLGAGMLLLFLIHNGLNWNWYKVVFKGKYTLQRIFRTVINLIVLISIALTGYSGIAMSKHVFAFLPIDGGMVTARKLHLAGSYWSFVLMSIHLGMHWSMITGKINKKQSQKAVWTWMLRITALAVAIYGAYIFGGNEIFRNMFLQNEFAILDYETPGVFIILQNLAMMSMWILVGHYLTKALVKFSIRGEQNQEAKQKNRLNGALSILVALAVIFCGVLSTPRTQPADSWQNAANEEEQPTDAIVNSSDDSNTEAIAQTQAETITVSDEFILISGGTFEMGSPESENWRSSDETIHTVTVSDFYMSAYELTQGEYEAVMGNNPSSFSGENLPVENISWLTAITYCNARSEQEGLTPVYLIDGENVSWNRGADGYRLPTEAEWEYACRAGTVAPFNTEISISAEESNYYGHYPYEIEGNYFEQSNLTTQPGQYRETTVAVDSFSPNAWGLYNMHGNVSEWVWDYYAPYETAEAKVLYERMFQGEKCDIQVTDPEYFEIISNFALNEVPGYGSLTKCN